MFNNKCFRLLLLAFILISTKQLLRDIQYYDIVGLTANCAKSCHLTGPYE